MRLGGVDEDIVDSLDSRSGFCDGMIDNGAGRVMG